VSKLSTRFTAAISNLKSRDERKRRRAIRELFEMDDPQHLKAFIPLLNDKDSWYRSKAIDAFRIWAPRESVTSLEPLIAHKNIDYNRVAANLLEKFSPTGTDVIKELFEKDDMICKAKAAQFILRNDNEKEFYCSLLEGENTKLKIIALESKYSSNDTLTSCLSDDSLKIVEYCLTALSDVELQIDDGTVEQLTKRGVKFGLLMPHLIRSNPEKLAESVQELQNHEIKTLVDLLNRECDNVEDEPINTLIQCKQYVVVGRWLQGKRGDAFDTLRWEIIADDSIDEIERSRFIERLFARCDEEKIRLEAEKIANNSTSELIKLTAHNLSTAKDRDEQ
tara:strand:+ start:7925 stop:8932 length:1008 start_codon:yes stop_codon:yes gene_type:complete